MPFRETLLNHTRERLGEFLREIQRVDESEFPYDQSKKSLVELRKIFNNRIEILNQLDSQSDPSTVRQECAEASYALASYLPLLGVILRSTQVRNAFEAYGPLQRMAQCILDRNLTSGRPRTQLVLSSGWDYSPLIYPDVPDLPGYVLIEFPAPESANPLLLPLAGHELGHSLWISERLKGVIGTQITGRVVSVISAEMDEFRRVFRLPETTSVADLTTDTDITQLYEQSETWALFQAEESFCDFVGLRIFGISYLRALSYLLAPKLSRTRSALYPNNVTRASNLIEAARYFGLTPTVDRPKLLDEYPTLFDDDVEPGNTDSEEFLVTVADHSLGGIISDLIGRADALIAASGIATADEARVGKIIDRFRDGVPARGTEGLPDIINAAWRAYDLPDLWQDLPPGGRRKDEILKDLVLKNIELYEIEQRQKGSVP